MRRPDTRSKPAPIRAIPVMVRLRLPPWLLAILLMLVTMALYWPATRCAFLNLDDGLHVTANIQVQKGLTWEGIKWGLSNPVNCIWHPITVWSHMADCQLFGLNPWGHHLTSVLLHAVNTSLVFLCLYGLTGAPGRSVLVAALFGWHPLHVESVAWVSERKDVLSGFFGLLALMFYARYAQLQSLKSKTASHVPQATDYASRITHHASRFTFPSDGFYLVSLFFFALGLMSKPMLVTWPFVMLLLDYWPLRRLQLKTQDSRLKTSLPLLLEKLPFFAFAAIASVVTFLVQQRTGALAAGESVLLDARIGNALISYCRYLGKLFWPTDLAYLYPHPGQWPWGKVVLAGALILGLSVLAWVRRRRHPYLLMGWLWYCGTLVPVIQLVQTGDHAMADRYTYLPLLGMLVLAAWGAHEVTRGWRYKALAWWMAGGASMVLCVALTRQQIGYWKDDEALCRHALEVTDKNDGAHNNLGAALGRKGQVAEAIQHFQEALHLKPHHADTHYNLGTALLQQGRTGEAISQFREAIRLKPGYFEAHNNLGTVLAMKGQTDEAIRHFQEAVRLKPDYADARKNLEILLATKARSSQPPSASTNH
jgi:protein O-mannosyl-transferase